MENVMESELKKMEVMESKWLNLSGGSTKGAAIAGMVTTLLMEKKFVPTGITGVSIGALLALPLLLGKHTLVRNLITSITLEQIFDNIPVTKKGSLSFSAIRRIVKSFFSDVHSLGTQNNLLTIYKQLVSKQEFENYKNSNLAPIYIGVVNINVGIVEFINIKQIDYVSFLETVMASSSIPLATELVELKKNQFYTDGGVAAHIGSRFVVKNFQVTEIINCFSVPSEVQVTPFVVTKKDLELANIALQVFNIQAKNNSNLILDYVDLYSQIYNIKNTNLHTPYLLKSLYDTDSKNLSYLYEAGVKEARTNYN
jgi:predicted acylesterase/phospholipase RssA